MASIDGNDLKKWNVTLLKDSFSSLLKYPKRTSINYTNYAERDGITADLRKFETESRDVSLRFFIEANTHSEFLTRYDAFFYDMNAVGYRSFDFDTGLIHNMRYNNTSSYNAPRLFYDNVNKFGDFTMNFIEDDYPVNSLITTPTNAISLNGLYIIDGVDFGSFGIHQDGKIGEILKYPDVKSPFFDGREYNLESRMLSYKEVTIPLWMIAYSKEEFIQNYQAFYNALAKPGLRHLFIKEINGTTEIYYTECSSYTITWKETIGVRFSIKFIIPVVTWESGATSIYTVLEDPTYGYLSDENNNVIILN